MWTTAAVAVVFLVALGAWFRVRGLARKLEQVTQQYWDLRYEHSLLKARVARLEPQAEEADPEPAAQQPPAQAFIPLSSLRR